jgi:hypothetical protein
MKTNKAEADFGDAVERRGEDEMAVAREETDACDAFDVAAP